jgi:hypothetical protein
VDGVLYLFKAGQRIEEIVPTHNIGWYMYLTFNKDFQHSAKLAKQLEPRKQQGRFQRAEPVPLDLETVLSSLAFTPPTPALVEQ